MHNEIAHALTLDKENIIQFLFSDLFFFTRLITGSIHAISPNKRLPTFKKPYILSSFQNTL